MGWGWGVGGGFKYNIYIELSPERCSLGPKSQEVGLRAGVGGGGEVKYSSVAGDKDLL